MKIYGNLMEIPRKTRRIPKKSRKIPWISCRIPKNRLTELKWFLQFFWKFSSVSRGNTFNFHEFTRQLEGNGGKTPRHRNEFFKNWVKYLIISIYYSILVISTSFWELSSYFRELSFDFNDFAYKLQEKSRFNPRKPMKIFWKSNDIFSIILILKYYRDFIQFF
jgi:hypothetical protein